MTFNIKQINMQYSILSSYLHVVHEQCKIKNKKQNYGKFKVMLFRSTISKSIGMELLAVMKKADG